MRNRSISSRWARRAPSRDAVPEARRVVPLGSVRPRSARPRTERLRPPTRAERASALASPATHAATSISMFIRSAHTAPGLALCRSIAERVRLLIGDAAERPHRLPPCSRGAEDPQSRARPLLVLLLRPAPRIVRRPQSAREGVQRRAPPSVPDRSRRTGCSSAPPPRAQSAAAPSPRRPSPLARRPSASPARRTADAVGHARAPLVEPNQPAEGRELLEERLKGRNLPEQLEVETKPGTKTRSNGPSPMTWYAMLTSPLRA